MIREHTIPLTGRVLDMQRDIGDPKDPVTPIDVFHLAPKPLIWQHWEVVTLDWDRAEARVKVDAEEGFQNWLTEFLFSTPRDELYSRTNCTPLRKPVSTVGANK